MSTHDDAAAAHDSGSPRGTTAGRAAVAALREHGVDTVFGIPGVQTYELFEALRKEPGIEVIATRHEQASAYMALGYAQSTGRPGVFSVPVDTARWPSAMGAGSMPATGGRAYPRLRPGPRRLPTRAADPATSEIAGAKL